MFVLPSNKLLQYSGRIDFTKEDAPIFVFPASYVKIRFTGKEIKAVIQNKKNYWDNYLGVILDGEQKKILIPETEDKQSITIAENLSAGEHELLLFKRQDSCHLFYFYGFELDDAAEVLMTEDKPKRKIEVYGDSVSAGEVSEAVEYVGKEDPVHNGEYSNSWYSYSWITARKLNAELQDVAQGGIALLDGTGYFCEPDYIGMESCFDKTQFNPVLGEVTKWDFDNYRPHVVIVASGQNDNHPQDYMAQDYNGEKAKKWREHYFNFIKTLRSKYENAEIILMTTILCHHENWDKSIDEVCSKLDDSKVHHFMFSNNGKGTSGHIRIPEAEKMAEELSAFIETLGEEIWD